MAPMKRLCSGWKCLSGGQQFGIVFSTIIVVAILTLVYLQFFHKKTTKSKVVKPRSQTYKSSAKWPKFRTKEKKHPCQHVVGGKNQYKPYKTQSSWAAFSHNNTIPSAHPIYPLNYQSFPLQTVGPSFIPLPSVPIQMMPTLCDLTPMAYPNGGLGNPINNFPIPQTTFTSSPATTRTVNTIPDGDESGRRHSTASRETDIRRRDSRKDTKQDKVSLWERLKRKWTTRADSTSKPQGQRPTVDIDRDESSDRSTPQELSSPLQRDKRHCEKTTQRVKFRKRSSTVTTSTMSSSPSRSASTVTSDSSSPTTFSSSTISSSYDNHNTRQNDKPRRKRYRRYWKTTDSSLASDVATASSTFSQI